MKEKQLSSAKQIIIGIFSVLIFWLFGLITGDMLDILYDTPAQKVVDKIPPFIFDALPFVFALLVISFALIGKLKNYKKMYWSAFIMTAVPYALSFLSENAFLDDGSVLSWLLIPVILVIYPFVFLGAGTYEAIIWNSYLFDYRDEWIYIIIGSGLIISLILFFTVKRKNKNNITNKISN